MRERYRSANVAFENKIDENGDRLIWPDPTVVDRLRSLRGPGESFSDVILAAGRDGA